MPIIRSSRLYLCYYRIWCVMPWLLVVGGQVQGSRLGVRDEGSCSSSFPHLGRIACCPAPDRRPPVTKALHAIFGNNTVTVSSSWWWAYKCPKHVEQITSTINHSVASSWFSSLRIYNDARTNIHQMQSRFLENLYTLSHWSKFCLITWYQHQHHIKRSLLSDWLQWHTGKPIVRQAETTIRTAGSINANFVHVTSLSTRIEDTTPRTVCAHCH